MTEALAVSHLNLDVADLDESERFYRDRLCLPVIRRADSPMARTPAFLLVLAQGTPSMGGSFHFGFRVASAAAVDAWFTRFLARGLVISESPVMRGAVYVGRVSDPDGYIIEVYSEQL